MRIAEGKLARKLGKIIGRTATVTLIVVGVGLGLRMAAAGTGLDVTVQPATGSSRIVKVPPAATLALDEGMRAFNAGNMEQAIKLLRAAASERVFLAQYYLARIYGTPDTRYANRGAAYDLYTEIAADNANRDPQMDFRSPFVARSELELARYLQVGIAERDIAPDPGAARDHLVRAAQIFGDADAQFELAKLDLANSDTERAGLDLLETVADRRGHAGALAFLSQLWLSGQHVGVSRPAYAYAYASLAMENAPLQDRIWIEQNFQRVFCATSLADREQGTELLPDLRSQNEDAAVPGPGIAQTSATDREVFAGVTWRCSDGEVVPSLDAAATAPTNGEKAADPAVAPATGFRPAAGAAEDQPEGFTPAGMSFEQLETPMELQLDRLKSAVGN